MAGTAAAAAAEEALRDLVDGGRSERLAAAHAMARLGRRFSAADSAVCLADPSPEVRAAMMPVVGGKEIESS
jgi:hypothetical protein